MNKDSLAKVASDIVASNRGILAADESTPTMGKRLAMIDQENTEENRRDFRQALFDTQGIEDYISGVILFDETLMQKAKDKGLTIKPIRTMINHATTEIFFDDLEIPLDSLIGDEGKGFKYILDGMNAERILIASECIGDTKFFLDKMTDYANSREVFG